MEKIVIKFDRKEMIKSMFSRTMIQQKPKIETNRKKYKRKKYNIKQEVILC